MNNNAEIKPDIIRQCMDLGVYTAEQFLVDKNCMCKEYQTDCSKCPMGKMLGYPDIDCCTCTTFMENNPCKAVSIVRNYAIKETLPSIELKEVKHAYWINEGMRGGWFADNTIVGNLYYRFENDYRCSDCNCIKHIKTNYCPNCGDIMDGDVNAHE